MRKKILSIKTKKKTLITELVTKDTEKCYYNCVPSVLEDIEKSKHGKDRQRSNL
jgi:hypothetical protein